MLLPIPQRLIVVIILVCVSLLQTNNHCWDTKNDVAPCKTHGMMHNAMAQKTVQWHNA